MGAFTLHVTNCHTILGLQVQQKFVAFDEFYLSMRSLNNVYELRYV